MDTQCTGRLQASGDYLLKEWSLKVADDFINNLEERVQNLSLFPHIGIASVKDPSIRSIVVTKHNKLYYRTWPEKIEYLAFLIRDKALRKTGMINFNLFCFF